MSIWQTIILIIPSLQLSHGNYNYHVKDTAVAGQNELNAWTDAASNLFAGREWVVTMIAYSPTETLIITIAATNVLL